MGLWTLECPNHGVFSGSCKVTQKGKGFTLVCPRGVTRFRSPDNDTCEAVISETNSFPREFLPKKLSKCEINNRANQALLSQCIRALKPQEGPRAVSICRKNIKCVP